jgi:hypothetical protein
MPLPEGRKPLSDYDMIVLLNSIARDLSSRDLILSDEIKQAADRLKELSTHNRAVNNE